MTSAFGLRDGGIALLAAAITAAAGDAVGVSAALAAVVGAATGLGAAALVRRRAGAAQGPVAETAAVETPQPASPRSAPPAPDAATPAPAYQPMGPQVEGLPAGLGRALLERLPSGLVLLDATGRVMFQNAAALDMLDRSMIGLQGAAALRAPALSEAIAAAFDEDRASEIEVTLLRSKERVIHATIRPLPVAAAPDPRAPAVLVLLEDRTRMAKAEALRRDFVANASHELKTPLASITGFIETLQGHARNDPEATKRFLTIMAAQADRMKRLVEDLLSLNRIEINEHVRPRDPVDVAALFWEVASGLAPLAAGDGARIEVALPREGLVVRGSRDEIAQVFVNLLDNAIKYAGADGPIRVVEAEPDPLRAGMVGLTVVDAGPGIAREHLPRLTERFYRVNVARSRERGGTGLGLAIVKHIVNRHRGDLHIASTLGEGARFTVWLPVYSGDPARP